MLRAGYEAIEARFRELTGKEITRPIIVDRSVDLDQGIGAQIRRFLAYLVKDASTTDTILNTLKDDVAGGQ